MASLYFYYSSMNAGKSSHLLQANHNYLERGMRTAVFNAAINDRDGVSSVSSRIGISAPAKTFDSETDLFDEISKIAHVKLGCVLVDEAQFLSSAQVKQLSLVVDQLGVPVLCYGLRTDYLGELFDGSRALLAVADNILEIKGVCFCGKKATMVVRVDSNGDVVLSGDQISIGGNDSYISVCRKHHTLMLSDAQLRNHCL